MTAATTSVPGAELPADIEDRKKFVGVHTVTALKEMALKHSIQLDPSWVKWQIVGELAKSDAVMYEYGWELPAPADDAEASTGNVDQDGDIIGAKAGDPVECDDDGFPLESTDVQKLDAEHLARLVSYLENQNDVVAPADADALVAWVVGLAYEQEEEPEEVPATEPDPEDAAKPAHIPTASPAPRTETLNDDELKAEAADNTRTDTEHAESEFGVEEDGQLTLVPGGDAPVKSILNIGSLAHDLGVRTEFKDNDRIRVSFEIDIDKIAFRPEKSGGEGKRRVRTHAGVIDKSSVEIVLL